MDYTLNRQQLNTVNIDVPTIPNFKVKDSVSCITHFVSCITAIFATPVLIIHGASVNLSISSLVALAIFMLSMVLLYGASASYHGFNVSGEAGMRLKRMDHMMIFILIAGSYTPVCVIGLYNSGHIVGLYMLGMVWSVAIVGMLFKLFWVTCPKWISSVIYISMGWIVIFAFPTLFNCINRKSFVWLLVGGIIYTIGGVLYALKCVKFNSRNSKWGSHEIFHLFVMGGSLCHFISIFNLF